MKSIEKKPADTDRQVRISRSGGEQLSDGASAQLKRVAGKAGNSMLDEHLKKATDTRDAMLAYIGARLQNMRDVQIVEHQEITNRPEWSEEVATGQKGFHLPDPTRWHKAATLYKRAAEAMCSGNLSLGAQIMEQALEAERTALATVPCQVADGIDSDDVSAATAPEGLPVVDHANICPAIALPTNMKYADHILNCEGSHQEADAMTVAHAWWELEQDEDKDEEEEEGEEHDTNYSRTQHSEESQREDQHLDAETTRGISNGE